MSKTLIYTAIFGNKDSAPYLLNPEFIPLNVEFVCYTDNQKLESEHYQIIFTQKPYSDPTRSARKFKICGPPNISSYDTAIWHDSSVALDCKRIPELVDFASKHAISAFKHAQTCTYAEARQCVQMRKDNPVTIAVQMAYYAIEESYPTRNGVYETTILVMNVKKYFGSELQVKWWRHLVNFSKRDQLSFPVAKQKTNAQIGFLYGRGHENSYSEYKGHIFDLDDTSNRFLFLKSVISKISIWVIFRLEHFVNQKKNTA